MASWNIGIDDVSEETQAFRNRLSSKDSQIAAQQTQLMKQAAELQEIKLTLNETLHKLSREADRALRLEKDLTQCSEDLRNEKITSQNVGNAFTSAQEKIKAKDLEARELQANIEKISRRSDDVSTHNAKLERDKGVLEARVRELDVNFQQLSRPPTTPGRLRFQRPRSSSLSDFRITTLEQELSDTRTSLSKKDTELRATNEKLARMQTEVTMSDNKMIAMERKLKMQVTVLESSLEEKEEELEFTKAQHGNGSREEELLKRVEEDEAKIVALEMLLSDNRELQTIKEKLKKAEHKLQLEMETAEAKEIELVKEREEALDELEDARSRIDRLTDDIHDLEAKQRDLQVRLVPAGPQGKTTQLEPNTPYPGHIPQVPDEQAVAYIERLLAAIDRLRGERDNLRRDLQFFETESKFTVEALEAKLAKLTVTDDRAIAAREEAVGLQIQLDEVMAREAEMLGERERQIRRLGLAATASAVVIGRLQSQTDVINAHIDEKDSKLAEANGRLISLEAKLEATSQCLTEATSQQNELQSQVILLGSKHDDWTAEIELLKNKHQEGKDTLERTEARLVDVAASLEEVESERDALALQLTNLQTDFNCAQQEVIEAESRYSLLQFHQLSSMSSNEVIRALRAQIEELEMRVLRRTEQIGIHQHDIKRLETNMRLQEERVGEMTVELEMLGEQKEAMVEDCADAREARDEAIQRVEALEEQLEALEGNLDILDQQRMNEATGLVGVVFKTIGHSRRAIAAVKAEIQQRTRQADEACTRACNDIRSEHQQAVVALQLDIDALTDETRQTTLALAVCKVELTQSAASLRMVDDARADFQAQVVTLREQLEVEAGDVNSLSEQLDTLQRKHLEAQTLAEDTLANRTRELETQLHDLRRTSETMGTNHQEVVKGLLQSQKELQGRLAETESMLANNNLESVLEQLKTQHVESLTSLQARLEITANELDEARKSFAHSERRQQQALDASVQFTQELETRLLAASDRLHAGEELESELTRLRTEHAEMAVCLRAQLDSAAKEAGEARDSRDELRAALQVAADELARTTQDYEHRLTQATEKSLAIQPQLEDSRQQVRQLDLKLRDEVAHRETHRKELRLANERYHQAESLQAELRDELRSTKTRLDETHFALASLQEEKGILQIETTNLEAEIQRSISLHRFLESQIKDSERTITSLREALERTRSALSSSEKLGQTAEMTLSLQTAQFERQMSNLNRELGALRSKPNLEETVAQLQVRNSEMDDLLRSKCAEIEENDDRFIEVLKEKKKLTTKIETLSRKVLTLQNKLAKAQTSTPVFQTTAPEPDSLATTSASAHVGFARPHSDTVTVAPSIPPVPSPNPATPNGRTLSYRIASGPSSLPRPKTPERRAQQAVFKARTPEKRGTPITSPEPLPSSSSSAIGKKRRAPDDFEACESVPAQGFTADSLPRDDLENTTPRLRRVLSGVQGFTPLRHHTVRPAIPMPSPKRVVSGAGRPPTYIADVTNSPRLASQVCAIPPTRQTKDTKRSWLGKIRGASSQANGKTSSRMFERLPGETT